MSTFYIIDGHYLIFRAYYAPFGRLSSPTGEPTKAVHAFCGTLFNFIRKQKPDYLAMAVDISDATVFRRDLYAEYKANREPPPEDFAPQANRIFEIVRAAEIPILSAEGFEADDVLATLADRAPEMDVDVVLVSRDKDLYQLIGDRVRLFDPIKGEIIDAAGLVANKGFTPEQSVEIQTLTGDSVDNIPGIEGVGPKTAIKLIEKYGSAAAVVDHADDLRPKQRDRVKEFASKMDLTRQLVTLRRDVPIEFDLESARFTGLKSERLLPIFETLGLHRMTEQLAELAVDGDGAAVESAALVTESSRGEYTLADTPEKLDALVADLAKTTAFAFDTETTGLNPVACKLAGISISWESGSGVYIPVRAAMGATLPVELVVEKLSPIFADPKRLKCGQNLKYDTVVLRQAGLNVVGPFFDTLIASYVLDPLRSSHGLDALARDCLGHAMIPISDLIGKGRDQITIDQVDAARVCEYAGEDADFTWRLFEFFKPQIESSPLCRVFEDVEMPLVEVLAEMEHNGIALNASVLTEMSVEITERLDKLTEEIHCAAGHTFNIDSTKQLANVLFDEQGLEVVRKTKTGRSTDADTLATLVETATNDIPKLVLEYRELTKLKSTYVDSLPNMVCKRTGRIHSSFNQIGAITGRLSSSDPNLQNIPIRTETGRKIRKAFVAGTPKNMLIVADYSQVELRILAHMCRDENLMQAFREGQDIHAFVAAQVNGVSLGDVTRAQRSAAKAVNFGIVYGQTAFGLSRSIGVSMAEAKTFIDTYFERYPGIRTFIDACIKKAREVGFAETILGRRRPIDGLDSRNKQRSAMAERLAVNTVVQGSAADLIKRAMIDIQDAIHRENRPSRMLLQVHDELVFETPASRVEAESDMIREKMTHAIPLDVPLAVDIDSGLNWLESK